MELLAYDRLERMPADEQHRRRQQIVKDAERARIAALFGSGGPSSTEPDRGE